MKTMACFLPLGLAAFVLSAHADVEITTDHSDAMYRCVEKAVFTVKVTAENGTLMTTGMGRVNRRMEGVLLRRTLFRDAADRPAGRNPGA